MGADVIKNLGWFQKQQQWPEPYRYLEYMPQNIFEGVHAELYEENTRSGEYKA